MIELKNNTLEYSLSLVIFYDCWEDWLKEIVSDMEKINKKKNVSDYEPYKPEIELDEWHTEKHMIWMLLVGMFGEWGTSIRSGWIEKHKFNDCIEFINKLITEEENAE